MLNFVKKFLPVNPVILEAGGRYGEDTTRMKHVWPQATIHVFEPYPSSFEKVIENTRSLSRVMAYPYALSNYSGKTHFYVNHINEGMCSIGFPAPNYAHHFEKTPIEVQCITLNQWSKNYHIDHIDFIWFDMEGHELQALQSSLDILYSVKAIYTEVNFVTVREGSCAYLDLRHFLEAQGFIEIWKSRDSGENADALFVRQELSSF